MLEDKLLILSCKRGRKKAMARIYEKYKNYLLTLANALLNEKTAAEDVVHDIFVSFAGSIKQFQLTGSLRGYLVTCVANLARDRIRARKKLVYSSYPVTLDPDNPRKKLIEKEESVILRQAIAQLPDEQREAVVLHLNGGMKFREIAKLQSVSVSTIHGRYRYGLDKLRSLLNEEVSK